MHIKFLPYGTGDPQKAVSYLLALHDHNGVVRPEVRVLRGNPKLVAEVAKTLSFVHRYTSGVISWHVDDDPSDEEVQAVLDDFERVAFAGMEPDQYSSAAIWHGGHVHIIAARVELRTGLSHNMAPPGRQKAFDHLRDYWNHTKGWARPDDPNRARQVQPGPMLKANLAAVRKVEADELLSAFEVEPDLCRHEQRRAAVVQWIRGGVLAGAINTRDDVISSLAHIGTLNRIGKDYLSIRLSSDEKPIRLKGTMFDERFDANAIRASSKAPANVVGCGRAEPDHVAAAVAKANFEEAIRRRATYNHGRYKVPALAPISLNTLILADVATEKKVLTILEKNDDRIGNPFIAELFQVLEVSKKAIRRLIRACGITVGKLADLDRASESLDRATQIFERVQPVLKMRRSAANHQFDGVEKGRSAKPPARD